MVKRLFWLLAVLLVTANSFLAANLLISKVGAKWETLTDLEVGLDAQPKSKATTIKYSDYLVINKRNLFRTASLKEEKTRAPEPVEAKPLTPLKLKLLGTVVGNIARPWAMILDLKTHKQDIYREGDTVTEATVVKIYRNKVVLNHGGKEELLLAFDSGLSLPGVEKAKSQPPQKRAEHHLSRFDLGRLGKRISRYRWELDRDEVTKAIENASQLLTQVRIIPHFKKGNLKSPDGFQVANVKEGGFFDKLGVMPGDIIKEVNGEAVNSPEKAFAAYQKFKNESNIKIVIERQNHKQTLTYDIP